MNSHSLFPQQPTQLTQTHLDCADSSSRTLIICLDLKRRNAYTKYESLDAVAKIKKLIARITTICDQLAQTEPQALWIITWRENGITDANSNYVSTLSKTYLKEELSKLSLQYTQLAIIGGLSSVKSVRDVGCNKKIIEIEDCYNAYQAFVTNEKNITLNAQWAKHLKQFTLLKNNRSTQLNIMRNTAYIFQQGNVMKHDKVLPFNETIDSKSQQEFNHVFQPAKANNANHFFNLTHPISKKIITIGIEICFEHNRGILKKQANNNEAVDIHFILSDCVELECSYFYGKYVVHVDSRFDTSIIKTDLHSDKSTDVFLYVNNLLEDNLELDEVTCERCESSLDLKF
ncbi:MAG: hypothetical protein P4M12_01200 [Gammaproteobacteria bacterium]|nr:hypothetical protein [Gammaproteobacteria bacterium]